MIHIKTLPKKEVVRRLNFILHNYDRERREIDISIIFDSDIWAAWNNNEFFSERFKKLDEVPHDIFVVRKSIIKKVKQTPSKKITLKQLQDIFVKGCDLTLGDFRKTGSKDDIINQINHIYFESYGKEAFTTTDSRRVPYRISHHEIFERCNARLLYKNIKEGKLKSNGYKILKLGNGSKIDAHYAFFDEFKNLDSKNKTSFFEKLTYIISFKDFMM